MDSDFSITSVAPTSTLCGGERDDKEEEIGLRSDDDEKVTKEEDAEPVKIFTKTYGLLIFWFVVCNVFILIKFAFFNMWLNWYFDGDQAQAARNDLLSTAVIILSVPYSGRALESKIEKRNRSMDEMHASVIFCVTGCWIIC